MLIVRDAFLESPRELYLLLDGLVTLITFWCLDVVDSDLLGWFMRRPEYSGCCYCCASG